MLNVTIRGSGEELRAWARLYGKHVDQVALDARKTIRQSKHEVAEWQAMCLYALATHVNLAVRRLDQRPGYALEIGTAMGYSAYFLSRGLPHMFLTTLTPNDGERVAAQRALAPMAVECLEFKSWDYLKMSKRNYDFIFVDGDHKQILRDLPWFNRLRPNGLILFHDVSPAGSARACPPVYEGVLKMAADLGRDPDVWLADEGQVGMAGFYRREGETWNAASKAE
jgi:predicted O-methyltransferase YrrM